MTNLGWKTAAKPGINLILWYMKIPVPHYPIPGLQEVWVSRQGESANWKQYYSACEESNGRSCLPPWLSCEQNLIQTWLFWGPKHSLQSTMWSAKILKVNPDSYQVRAQELDWNFKQDRHFMSFAYENYYIKAE